ncbi:MAG: hypothetical protein HQL69_17690 [Magnetococcales bacterium]|nr:hypothetical protein [Magnetococcales bacterium]
MSYLNVVYQFALIGTIILCLLLSIAIWKKAGDVPGIRYLLRFVLGTSAGIGGFWLISTPDESMWRLGEFLVATSPLVAGLFNHFAYRFSSAFSSSANEKSAVKIGYIIGVVGTLWSWFNGLGSPVSVENLPRSLILSYSGWGMVAMTLAVTTLGHARLFASLTTAEPQQRRQILAVIGASLWGFLAIAGFFLPSLGVGTFPYLVVLLPGYPVLLVYGLMRYQLMDINVWAQRTVSWLLLTIPITGVGVGVLVLLASPEENPISLQVWMMQFFSLTAAFLLVDTIRSWADRLIYPGSHLDHWRPQSWSAAFAEAEDLPALAKKARQLISTHLKMAVAVHILPPHENECDIPESHVPTIICHIQDNTWTHILKGWDNAPPGPRLAGDLFGRLISDSAHRIEHIRQAAEKARKREKEAHLAELGLLAATVAHELRNPLNVVGMAATGVPDEAKREIKLQLERMNGLISDLLDYSKAWQIAPRSTILLHAVENALSAYPHLKVTRSIPKELQLHVDPQRLQQVLGNLLANANAAIQAAGRGSLEIGVCIKSESIDGEVRVAICNQGSPIPDNLREKIFAPFVTCSAGGTGLGLAIVSRIMESHGGTIRLQELKGWQTCFVLSFPKVHAAANKKEMER